MALSGTFEAHPISGSQFGIVCEWSGTQNKVNNTTTVVVDVYARFNTLNIGTRSGTITIAGTQYSFTSPEIRESTSSGNHNVWIGRASKVVTHNSDGTKTISMSVTWNCDIHDYAGQAVPSVTASTTATLTAIDRSPASVEISVSDIASESATLFVTSDKTCDRWDYRIDGGSWVNFSEYEGQSATTTLTLTPGTSYTVEARARRKLNHVYGTSASFTFESLGGSRIDSVGAITLNSDSPMINYTLTIFDSTYTHRLAISLGNTSIAVRTGITGFGTSMRRFVLTQSEIRTAMTAMPTTSADTLTYILTTYDGSGNVVGVPSVATGPVYISEDAAPTLSGISTVRDTNLSTQIVTGNDSFLIQNKSTLRIISHMAVPSTGTSIVLYRATIGDKTVESESSQIDFGTCNVGGSTTVYVTAIDARGMSAQTSAAINIIPYRDINFTDWSGARQNGADATIDFIFGGTRYAIDVNGVDKNAVITASYRYKITSASSWSDSTSLGNLPVSGNSYSYVGTLTLDERYAYYVEITVSDALSTSVLVMYVNKGRPLVALREERVGILTNTPQSALDVDGVIRMNGQNVMGVMHNSLDGDMDLNNIVAAGLYFNNAVASTTTNHYPADGLYGLLEVFDNLGMVVMQRYTERVSGTMYVRTRVVGNWTAWTSH